MLAVPLEILGSSPGYGAGGRNRETHGTAHNWPSVPAGMSLFHRALATPVAGQAQCTLTRPPGVQCFRRHIGVAGFSGHGVKKQCDCVSEDARLSTFISPESVRELQRWDKTVFVGKKLILGGKKLNA